MSRLQSLHARLALWSAAVIGVVLLVYTAAVFAFLQASLYEELDAQLSDEAELAEGSLTRFADGRVGRVGGAARDPDDVSRRLEVWNLDGTLAYREGPATPVLPPPGPVLERRPPDGFETVRADSGSEFRVRYAMAVVSGLPVVLRVARPEGPVRHELRELLVGVAFGLPTAVLLALLGGSFLAGRALRPVGEMAAQAGTITAERLSERLPIENPDDELGRLGTVFNDTLGRLERSFESLRRFTADAAHELRTPLTAMRSVGEVGLRESKGAVPPEVVGSMLEEVDRLTALVDTLLMLSRADTGRIEVHAERIELRDFARDAVEYLEALAGERDQRIEVEGGDPVYARADPGLLRQAVLNVLDNAIKHSPEGGAIRVAARSADATAMLDIVDEGPGIPPEHREQIFERFYRVDSARSRETGGAGLGLAISRWAVQANGGSIEVDAAVPRGTRFRILLPDGERSVSTEASGQAAQG